ncbi:MAG TPA: bifunctional methylenetetrahydrofolate dehydrogenase/methenyltetrahydrofolate cyclohydrolase FolD [Tissierellia bacterium]|nr:bifunctional methylenetetrahydrofolate dehydrogenase/methenyltetrahydrofolate cyclohydrolase FolD [Tissierellia bacterium]
MIRLEGSKVAADLQAELTELTAKYREQGIVPGLAVILVGEDPASKVYVGRKEKMAEKIGIKNFAYNLPSDASQEEVLELIDQLNRNDEVDGILVQLPLPAQIDEQQVLQTIDPAKDVDSFHPENVGKLMQGLPGPKPCTPNGIMHLLKAYDIPIEGRHAVIIGRSNIVGKPMAHLLLDENATVTITHSRTKELAEITRLADILVVAIGRPNFLTGDMIKDGAVVIDVGINRLDKKLVGDVDYETVAEKSSFITPVPGGVGPMTIIMLMYNTVKACELRRIP